MAQKTDVMVSIIIPAYNIDQFIGKAIESAVSQTFTDMEIIVVNDGSTDQTGKIIDDFSKKDNRIKAIHRPNGGLSAARNSGLDLASGQWIMFLDGDDCLAPDGVESLLSLAEKYNADIACGGFTKEYPVKPAESHKIKVFTSRNAIENALYQRSLNFSACGKIFKNVIFEKLRFREGILYEDLDIIYHAFEHTDRIVMTDRLLYYYRTNPQSILNTFSTKRFDILDVTDRIVRWSDDKPSSTRRAAKDRRFSAHFNILGLLAAHDLLDTHANVARRCRKVIKGNRISAIVNPRVRLKNKAGALLSFTGNKNLVRILKKHYQQQ